jgi:hypothetical protein
MAAVAPFHAWNEPDKSHPRYHIDDSCPAVKAIPRQDIRAGSGGFYLCEQCAALQARPLTES